MLNARRKIQIFGLLVASGAGILAAANIGITALQPSLLPATAFAVCVEIFLFIRMTFSPYYQMGIQRANRDMQGTDPWPGKFRKITDAEWGFFGARTGNRKLLLVRAVLFIGAMPLLVARSWASSEVIELWWTALFISMNLSLMHVAIVSNEQGRQ